MKICEIAIIRTGLVLSRKEASLDMDYYTYPAISLKNITEDGQILLTQIENYYAAEELKREYFTQDGDILLRLSTPYTAILITEKETNLLVPSHFAIIRVDKTVDPNYLHWWLAKNRKRFYQMASGGTMMGTISAGYVSEISVDLPSLDLQRKIAKLSELEKREQQLLLLLSEKKKKLIDAIITKIINNKGEV